jgi:predicted transcriptional regulator of viral defense system
VGRVQGEASEVARSDERTTILEALREARTMTPKDIMVAAGLTNRNSLDILLYRMEAGEVEKVGRGLYQIPQRPTPGKKRKKKDRR